MKARLIGHIYPADKHGKHLLLAQTDDPSEQDLCIYGTKETIYRELRRMARAYDQPFLP